MIQYIPGGIFRAFFKFCMGDKLREKMGGEVFPTEPQAMRRWRGASANVLYECDWMIVLYECYKKKYKNKQKEWHTATKPLKKKSKIKPCTRRGPKIGKKKTRESCDVQTFYIQVNAVVGSHMKE
jgi:hypothetical protein